MFNTSASEHAQYTKIVVWDFDGTIVGLEPSHIDKQIFEQIFQTCATTNLHPDITAFITPVTNNPFWLIKPNYFKITFELLDHFNILSVLGSQRMVMGKLQYALNDCNEALNFFFGKKRQYLTNIEALHTLSNCNDSKNDIIQHYTNKYQVLNHSNITLIDDALCYEMPTKNSGYNFIHATSDLSHLFEVVKSMIPSHQLQSFQYFDIMADVAEKMGDPKAQSTHYVQDVLDYWNDYCVFCNSNNQPPQQKQKNGFTKLQTFFHK